MEPSIYEYPDVFRRAHLESPGEIPAEVFFLQQVWKRHRKSPTRRILDIACGDSPHGRLLAGDGFEVVGIDRSPTMIAAGRRKANELPNLRFYRRPIEKFTLPERAFDAAIFMSETFPVIVENADLLSHLKISRPCAQARRLVLHRHRSPGSDSRAWRSARCGASAPRARAASHSDIREFHRPIAWHSPLHSIYELECTINFPAGAVTTRDLIPVRYTTPSTLELAALASGMFKMVAAYCDLSFTKPLDKCRYRWLGSAAPRVSSGVAEMIDAGRAARHASRRRSEESESSRARRPAHDAVSFRTIARITPRCATSSASSIARRPQSQHAFEAALDAIGKVGAALALGIGVGRREPIGVPSRELVGIALANLVRGESFEQSEVHFGELIDRDERRRRRLRRFARLRTRERADSKKRGRSFVAATSRLDRARRAGASARVPVPTARRRCGRDT